MYLFEVKQDVEHAFRILEFALRTKWYFEDDKVDIRSFGEDTLLRLECGNKAFDDKYFLSKSNALKISNMNVGAAFGISAIELNKLFQAARKRIKLDSGDPVDTLWCLVYAVRNAFAHEIGNPKWVIKKYYQKKIDVEFEDSKITINLETLDGCNFDYEQI